MADETKNDAPAGDDGHGPRSPNRPSASDRRSEPTPDVSSPEGQDSAVDDPVVELEAERDEYLDLAQRARAELENYRKRTAGELAAAEHRGREAVALEVLPALDNLERALLAAGVSAEPDGEAKSEEVSAADAFGQGVSLVYRELRSAIARAGISELEPTGEPFDPNHHEAVATRAEDGVETGTVLETLQRGYLLGERSIRPARVIVAE